jgi:hypothetical protein
MNARLAAIALAGTTLVLLFVGFALGGGTLGGFDGRVLSISAEDLFQLVTAFATAAVGLNLSLRRPRNPIGWIFSWLAVLTAFYLAAGGYAVHATIVAPGSLPGGEWAAWLRSWADRPVSALVLLAFLLFPTGRLASSRWRVALLFPPLAALGFAARGLVPGPLVFLGAPNPMGVEWMPQGITNGSAGGIPLIAGSVAAFAQLVSRFRAASGPERDQIKWLTIPVIALLLAMAVTVGTIVAGVPAALGVDGPVVTGLYLFAFFLLPICMGIAVLRYRLYDIDVILNRAIVYGATTAGIAAAFFAGIVVLQAVLRPITSGSELAVAASTLVSLALFQPLRRRVQETVDRRFYRSRYDAARTLDAFSARLRDEVALDNVRADLLNAVLETVQPAHASVWIRE